MAGEYPPKMLDPNPEVGAPRAGFTLPLMEGERVLREIRPVPSRVARYSSAVNGIVVVFAGALLLGLLVLPALVESGIVTDVATGVLVVVGGIAACEVLTWLVSMPFVIAGSRKLRYWITNRRIITRSGVIGYGLSCMPIERVTDVRVHRSFISLLTGAPVLTMRDVAPNNQLRAHRWIGVDDPERVQMEILEAAHAAREGRRG